MSLFRKKLTSSQHKEILRFAHSFYSICSPCGEAFSKFQSQISPLYQICREALMRDIEPEGVSVLLVGEVQEACLQYAQFLTDVLRKYQNLGQPARWYPRGLRKACESRMVCLSGEMRYLEMAIKGIASPKPLAHEPRIGNDKLNLFVAGLNYMSFFEIRLKELPIYDLRSTELLLGVDLSFEDEKRIMEDADFESR